MKKLFLVLIGLTVLFGAHSVRADYYPPSYPGYYCCDAVSLSRRTVYLVDRLEGYADYKEYGAYLLPIKKAAGYALAAAEANGNLSSIVRQRLLELKKRITFADSYLEHTFEVSNAFYLAMELLSVRDELDRCLY